MIDFETDLEDLRDSSRHLATAADAAEAARSSVSDEEIPVRSGDGGFFDVSRMLPGGDPDNAFGKSLGMPSVASAFERHRQAVEKLLAELHDSAESASRALSRVADLYEESDARTQARVQRIGDDLTGL